MYLLALLPFYILAVLWTLKVFRIRTWLETLFAALPLGMAFCICAVGIAGRIFGEIQGPFFILSFACLALAGIILLRGKLAWPNIAWPLTRLDIPWVLTLLTVSILVGIVTCRYAIFDEVRLQGHIPVVEQMLRGKFPPTYIAFPEVEFRYHYGFNLLAALLARAFRVPGYLGIDLATMACWSAFVANLLFVLRGLGIPRRGWALGFIFIVLSGGLSWWLVAHHDGGAGMLFQLPNWQQMFIFGRVIHPSFIMYFFQHPISLGLVFFLAMLRCFQEWHQTGCRRAYWTGVFLLGVMSLAQVMLFVTSLAALGGVFLHRIFKGGVARQQTILEGLGVLLGALSLAFALGGFFQWGPGAESQALRFTWPPGYLNNEFYARGHPMAWSKAVFWYFSGFGLALVLIPWAWWRAVKSVGEFSVLFLGIFSGLSFLIPHFFQYSFSWDIVKWFFAFEFGGRILVAWAFWPWISKNLLRQLAVWALVLFGTVTPMRFLTELSFRSQAGFSRAELRIAGYTRPNWEGSFGTLTRAMIADKGAYGMVLSSPATSVSLAMATGFPMLQLDNNTVAMPVGRDRIELRRDVLKALNDQPSRALLEELGVRWVVYSCGEVRTLSQPFRQFLDELSKNSEVEQYSQKNSSRDCYQAYRLK